MGERERRLRGLERWTVVVQAPTWERYMAADRRVTATIRAYLAEAVKPRATRHAMLRTPEHEADLDVVRHYHRAHGFTHGQDDARLYREQIAERLARIRAARAP